MPADPPPSSKSSPNVTPKLQYGEAKIASESLFSANADVVNLEDEAVREGLSVGNRIALKDAELREQMAIHIISTLIIGNLVTLVALAALVWLDQRNLESNLIKSGDRIIDHQVIMALLGATTVQVGTIAVIIARYLFPGRSRDS